MIQFEKETAGVLFLCAKKGLKAYYADKAFDYDFPDGILELVNQGIALAFITESGEDITGKLIIDEAAPLLEDYAKMSENKLFIDQDDELFILSHAELTQVCDSLQGDLDAFKFWDEKIAISNLKAGWKKVISYAKTSTEMPYIDMVFQLFSSEVEPVYEDCTEILAI